MTKLKFLNLKDLIFEQFRRFGENYVYWSSDWKENLAISISGVFAVLIVSVGLHIFINYVHRRRHQFCNNLAGKILCEISNTGDKSFNVIVENTQ